MAVATAVLPSMAKYSRIFVFLLVLEPGFFDHLYAFGRALGSADAAALTVIQVETCHLRVLDHNARIGAKNPAH
jgi:hypothetical protein